MSRRSNVLGGVGVEVSPSSASTINNIVTIRNTPSYPNMPTDGGVEYAPSKPSSESIQLQKSSSGVLENPYQDRSLETAEQRKDSIEALTSEKNLFDALSLMVDVVYSNPLLVNKLVVTDRNTLSALIRLLTESDSVNQ